ncbi:hypothetical protein YC2023_008420 [Brassica napus]|uniref:Uncharacterized protein n=1 Tax=Brassica oleracea TaxID=3712 RepID=A0A3P6EV71_BRAOL|nr:unnamed protein product [Brassica oleracea]
MTHHHICFLLTSLPLILCYFSPHVSDDEELGLATQIVHVNTDYLDKYSEDESKLDFVERTLRWRHLAPTA